jgi:hypothetical protein|nr:hypothetical protein [Neorhizobium tomejilense]
MVGETSIQIENQLEGILGKCRDAFAARKFEDLESSTDLLMQSLSVTPSMKAANRQYWGRELGIAWENLLKVIWKTADGDCHFPMSGDPDHPCDIVGSRFAVDAKYRVGSGDSGTLQKLRRNGATLRESGKEPILLVFRDDSLRSSLAAAKAGGWTVKHGEETLRFVKEELGFDLRSFLSKQAPAFKFMADEDHF